MEIGVTFPQTEFPAEAAAVRDYAQAVEGMGYAHVLAYDHVLGANPQPGEPRRGPYTYTDPFFEPLLLFAHMAAVTQTLGFVTGILILPQRQTALAAKQAATLDVLCGGRLRLGVGLGWNDVEYAALGEDFHTRGRRIEEQVELLRRLWTEPLVTFDGRWHTIPEAGLNPLPVQRPIPIWFGGQADAVLRRTARLGDGWMPNHRSPAEARPALETLRRYLGEAGRARTGFGVEARVHYGDGDPKHLRGLVDEWAALGATHLTVNTMRCGFETPAQHLSALQNFIAAVA